MTPPYSANSSSSPFPFELSNEDHDHHHHQNHNLNFTTPNYHNVSSSSSAHSQPSHLFLNSRSSWDNQPQLYYDSDPQFFYPQHPKVDNNHAANGGSYDQGPKTKASLWRSTNCEDSNDHHTHDEGIIPVKWMSSKMRVMQKMKSSGSNRACQVATMASTATTITTTVVAATTTTATTEMMKIIEDQKRASSCLESEHSSNSSSNHSSSNVVPIRVCADCNTTKTPLWRSGPKGPKSLCNACGIRQRKARRAMAAAAAKAAAAAATGAAESSLNINKAKPTKEKPTTAAAKNPATGVNHHHHHDEVTPFKKRYKIVAGERPSDHEAKKTKKKKKNKMNGFEDFLIKLSKNSAYHRVFPQDEKDAAILLMALSCGLVHS
ncbi:PREDICTED: GATA transcription factor 21-like [Ipomoea nil]|uniref:GATA transcription factor 21-like n=1 Tax=Ipomoea nil TaxID=35883 RepID=UPI0009016802|nr:PREDICTED: GATA transcription factor 21-like [Ipomoea nil]